MKPGWQTTEFWLTVAATIIALLYSSGVIGDGTTLAKIVGFIAAALTSMGYSVSRGLAKSAQCPTVSPPK